MAENGVKLEGIMFEAAGGASGFGAPGEARPDARQRTVSAELQEDDLAFDRSLRPKRLGD